MTNEKRCLLASKCRLAGGEQCVNTCGSFIAMHGMSGAGGRAGAAGLPEEYRLVTLGKSPARGGQTKVYAMLDAYVATFERQFEAQAERIKSLYLYSESPGTGKTTTAAALINAWLVEHYLGSLKRGIQPSQQPAYFLDVNEMQTEYNLASMTDDDAGMKRIRATIERCQRVPYLVMDDIGVRGATEAFRAYLHAIINARTTNGLPTVYTSNLPIEDMARVFDARLYDRMRDMCLDIHFDGTSKRGRR